MHLILPVTACIYINIYAESFLNLVLNFIDVITCKQVFECYFFVYDILLALKY